MLRLILVQVLSKLRNHCSTLLGRCFYAGSKRLPRIWTSASHPVPSNNPCISTSTLLGLPLQTFESLVLPFSLSNSHTLWYTREANSHGCDIFRLQSQSRPLPRSPGYWFEAPLACISFVTVAAATVLTQRTPSLMLFHCTVITLVLHYIGLATVSWLRVYIGALLQSALEWQPTFTFTVATHAQMQYK